MSQLESLLSISRMQSEQQLAVLQQKRQAIESLNRQLDELLDYSRSYQSCVVGTDGNLATLLVHRQLFVGQLATQINELANRICALEDDAASCALQWHYFEARQKAIESMHEKKSSQEKAVKEAMEQTMLDELARSSSSRGFDSEQHLGLDYA